jgi:hypothetical protein
MITNLSETDIAILRQMAADFRARNPGTFARQTVRQPRVVEGQIVKIGKANADITTGTVGTITIWRRNATNTLPVATTETVDAYLDWLSTETITSGKMVLIQFFDDENAWRIVGAECE